MWEEERAGSSLSNLLSNTKQWFEPLTAHADQLVCILIHKLKYCNLDVACTPYFFHPIQWSANKKIDAIMKGGQNNSTSILCELFYSMDDMSQYWLNPTDIIDQINTNWSDQRIYHMEIMLSFRSKINPNLTILDRLLRQKNVLSTKMWLEIA